MKFNKKHRVVTILFGAALTFYAGAALAQNRGNDDHGRDHKADDHNGHHDDYHFRSEDRDHFRGHYQSNLKQWQQHPDRRHHVRAGEQLPNDYKSRLKSVPSSYYRSVPPPPAGYRFGYYDGYVVAYNPTTRIIADVLDLVDSATHR